MLAGLSFIALIVWLVLFFAWGNFWRVWEFDADHDALSPPQNWPRVTAVVPARNEAESIAAAVTALAQQDYPGEFSVIIVDDHSDDATAQLARQAAAESGAAARLQVLQSPELAPGWTGKLWALNAGVSCARSVPPGFFWFTDADVV